MTRQHQNPYVGPRAYKYGESLPGRDDEVAELRDLLIAERIVLLHSPSGAGKSSLVEAGLRAELTAEGFRVLPTTRVSHVVLGATVHPNAYGWSVLLSLQDSEQSGVLPSGAYPGLSAALDALPPATPGVQRADVLIFDQFEEILSLNPIDQEQKVAFFDDVGKALRNPDLWALFVMREEYVAALDPFLRLLPTRLTTRFRLDLLKEAGALRAIIEPAKAGGVLFEETAARVLVSELQKIQTILPDGRTGEVQGTYVEPVQLQVVCTRLWNSLPESTTRVSPNEVSAARDVHGALGAYYDETVTAIAHQAGTSERQLRDWFGGGLISRRGLRTQATAEAAEAAGVQLALAALVEAHLIRQESRLGSKWYELAHDRLIQPVRDSNDRWLATNASDFERWAAAWKEAGRPPERLLTKEELKKGEKWQRTSPEADAPLIQDFFSQSRTRVAEQRARMYKLWSIVTIVVAAVVVATAFGVTGLWTEATQLRTETTNLRSEVEMKQSAVQSAQSKLQVEQRERKLAESTAGKITQDTYGGTSLRPEQKVAPDESYEAYRRLQRVQSTQQRTGTIRYFSRDVDPKVIDAALASLGFKIESRSSRREALQTNAVWYGPDVPYEETRIVALALLRAGVGIQAVRRTTSQATNGVIQIGNTGNVTARRFLTVEEVEMVSNEHPNLSVDDRPAPSRQ
ncbi:MAG: ATP-binding protein [Vicinamibacterales bacterium]